MSDVLFLGNFSSANNRAKDRKTPEGNNKSPKKRLQGKNSKYIMVVLTLTGWACCLAAGMGQLVSSFRFQVSGKKTVPRFTAEDGKS